MSGSRWNNIPYKKQINELNGCFMLKFKNEFSTKTLLGIQQVSMKRQLMLKLMACLYPWSNSSSKL